MLPSLILVCLISASDALNRVSILVIITSRMLSTSSMSWRVAAAVWVM